MLCPVLVVENHPVVLAAVASLIRAEDGLAVWGEAASGEQAIEMLRAAETLPDLVLADIGLGTMTGLALIGLIRTEWPDVSCVVLSAYRASLYRSRAEAAGACAYVEKRRASDLTDVLRAVSRGGKRVLGRLSSRTGI